MRTRQWVTVSVLSVVLLLVVVALILTGTPQKSASNSNTTRANQGTLVDQRPLQTARSLAGLATTPEEQSLAQETLRLADHEVDLAFADALRDAKEHPVQLSAEARELSRRVEKSEAAVKADQERVNNLAKAATSAEGDAKDKLKSQLDIANAQLTMDQDEADDAKEDLIRAGGDPESKIQRLLDEHEAAQHASDAHPQPSPAAPDSQYEAKTLAAQLRAWMALRGKHASLGEARSDAQKQAEDLTAKHQALEQHVSLEDAERQSANAQARSILSENQKGAPAANAAATLSSLQHFSEDQKAMSDLDKRVQDEQELAEAYGSWLAIVQSHQKIVLHGVIQSTLWIVLILLLLYLTSRAIESYFHELTPEKKRLLTVRVVIRFAIQALGVLLILFVIFGAPNQTPTILGLAGAGLTVALKDFIVAFFGWFVLMGRNGIRVGDWVEINGVGGEVIEIGLLRTVLLETGNWTDSGHPTGRKVAFVNSYAVEGHYFNFSTSGQWLWDEIRFAIPSSQNPYPTIQAIQKLVSSETEANGRLAEDEWKRAAGKYQIKSFSGAPAIDVRPTGSGVEVIIRYITQAHQRHELRARLHQAIVNLLHQKHMDAAAHTAPSSV
ncbi:MAG TPA: mechanosensitive ion channel domain-containing protein [Terriglobales bacterium]|nr:mechanosensitive ion channel domain-containing protein [Terriglobales bacterium]